MTLASPLALWWLAVGLPVAALFFFKVRPTEVVVPALALWEKLVGAREVHGFGVRFGRWPTLLAQLGIVALLALVLSDPRLGATPRGFVIVLDDSASMTTREDVGRTRFELAKATALDRIRAAGPDDVGGVVLAGEPLRVVANGRADRPALQSTIAALAPRDVNADTNRALRLAASIAADAHAGSIVVISDKPQSTAEAPLPIEWIPIGRPQPNVGIIDARKSIDGRELIVMLHQQGFDGRPATLRLMFDGREQARTDVTLSGRTVEPSLPAPTHDGQAFQIICEPPDARPLDNVFNGVWPAPVPARVLLVTKGNLELTAALSQPGLMVETVSPEQWNPAHAADVVVLDAPEAPPRDPADGRYIVFGGTDPFGLTAPIEAKTDQRPVQWSPDHPVLRDVDLVNWQVRRTSGMGASPAAAAIVSGADAPLVLDAGSALFVNFDLNDSNVPTRASFPIFVWNAVQYLLGRPAERGDLYFATGRPARVAMPSPSGVRVTGPRGEPCEAVAESDAVLILQPQRAGPYEIDSAAGRRMVALNWVSDGADARDDRRPAAALPSAAAASWLQPLWSRLLIAAAAVILLELVLFHLKVLRMG